MVWLLAMSMAARSAEAEICLSDGQSLVGFPDERDDGTHLSLARGWAWIPRESQGPCGGPLRVGSITGDLRTLELADHQVLYGTPRPGPTDLLLVLLDGHTVLLDPTAVLELHPPPSHVPELAPARVAWEGGPVDRGTAAHQGVAVVGIVVGSVVVFAGLTAFALHQGGWF